MADCPHGNKDAQELELEPGFFRRYSPTCPSCDKHTIPQSVAEAMDPLLVVAGYNGATIGATAYAKESKAKAAITAALKDHDSVRVWAKGTEPAEATAKL